MLCFYYDLELMRTGGTLDVTVGTLQENFGINGKEDLHTQPYGRGMHGRV